MRKIFVSALPAALAAAAVAVAGCGNSSSSGSALSDALSFMPKGSPLVVSIDTDPNGQQLQQANKLLERFGPVAAQFKQGFQNGLKQQGFDYQNDLKPIIGNRLVAVAPSVTALNASGNNELVALKAKDAGKAKDVVARMGTKAGTVDGNDVYRSHNGQAVVAVVDGTLVNAPTQAQLQQAIARHNGGDSSHMTESDYDRLVAGVKKDALAVVGVDVHALVAQSPKAAKARQVKWVGALQTGALDIGTESNAIVSDFAVKTSGVTSADLPLATGTQSPALVRRAAEVGFGLRGFPQTWAFGKSVAQITSPQSYARFVKQEGQANKQLGIDIEKDIVQQLSGDMVASVGIDGSYAFRTTPKNPGAFKTTLAKYMAKATKLPSADFKSIGRGPAGLYVLTGKSGKKAYAGMIGSNFVVAKDPARAQQVAAESTSNVPGANGALTVAFDAKGLVNAVADKQGASQAKLFTGSLGDFVGSVQSSTSGLTGSFRLNFK